MGIVADMTAEHREALLHYTAAFIGGLFGLYAIICRLTFGSAQTMNLISLISDLLGDNIEDFLYRLGVLILYSLSIVLTVVIGERRPRHLKLISLSIDAAATLILGFFPEDMNHILGLYPIFFAMAFQWCSFKGAYGFVCSSVFSTNNLRQFLTGVVSIVEGKESARVSRMHVFGLTLLSFHLGVAVQFLLWERFGIPSIWFAFIPIAIAAVMALAEIRDRC